MKDFLVDVVIAITIMLVFIYFLFGNLYLIDSLSGRYGNGSDAFIHITTITPFRYLGVGNLFLIPFSTYLILRFYSSAFKARRKAKGRVGGWVDYI